MLPARLDDYRPAWLDDLCLRRAHRSGRGWRRAAAESAHGRGRAGARDADRCCSRRAACGLGCARARLAAPTIASRARARERVLDFLAADGASFFDEHRRSGAGCCAPKLEEALAELVARGPRQLRQLRGPARAARARPSGASPIGGRRPPSHALFGIEDAGRWALRARAGAPLTADAALPASGRARRAHPAAPLRRRVLAPARTRGVLAAAVARSAARLPPARGARRDPRRPLRRRLLGRAVRAAGSGRHAARGAARAGADGTVSLSRRRSR